VTDAHWPTGDSFEKRHQSPAQKERKLLISPFFIFELVVMLTGDPICRYMYISAC
jgi:hypothetical protein